METNTAVHGILEIGFGLVYLFAAGFNITYTLRYGKKLYLIFAEGTWFTPARWLIPRYVIPHPRMLTVPLILVQLFIGIALLSQGTYVGLGLLAGTAFSMYAVFVSNFPGAILNIALAVLQFYLVTTG